MVGGEAGDEAILPLDILWGRMKQVVSGVIESKLNVKARSSRTAKDGMKEKTSKGKTVYNRYEVHLNVDMESIDQIKKLKRLLDDLEDGSPEPQMA